MARLIDADKLRERHCEGCNEDIREMCRVDPVCASLLWVDEEPTVDAVEVVRCRDCKHFVSPQGVPACACFYGLGFPNHSGDDFCSYGERKDNA